MNAHLNFKIEKKEEEEEEEKRIIIVGDLVWLNKISRSINTIDFFVSEDDRTSDNRRSAMKLTDQTQLLNKQTSCRVFFFFFLSIESVAAFPLGKCFLWEIINCFYEKKT